MANTKIIATLGPASNSGECLRGLLAAGVSIFRLNASHGTWEEHAAGIQPIRQAAGSMRLEVAILLDLQGPKIRLGRFENGGCTLENRFVLCDHGREYSRHPTACFHGLQQFCQRRETRRFGFARGCNIRLRAIESDGTSVRCRVISGGPSVGKYPIEAARMMSRIAVETGSNRRFRAYRNLLLGDQPSYPEIVAAAACQAAKTAGVEAIVVFTTSGKSARLISRLRPRVPIYAFTPSRRVVRELVLSYGVHPMLSGVVTSTDQMLAQVETMLLEVSPLKREPGL
jgi:pyruvate kinase